MKIPKQAKRVFKGKVFSVHHWKQKMFDGTFETFEMVKRDDTTQVIAVEGEKILVTSEKQPDHFRALALPGGRVDEGEAPLQAAKRELLEETGLKSDDWQLYKVYEPSRKIQWQVYFYIAKKCQKAAAPHMDNGEIITVRKVSFKKFVELFSSGDYGDRGFTADILRLRLEPKKLKKFEKNLFRSNR